MADDIDPIAEKVAAQLNANPAAMRAYLANKQKTVASGKSQSRAGTGVFGVNPRELLAQYGIDLPHDYGIDVDPTTGQASVKKAGWLARNMDWLAPVATIGGGAIIGAVAGGSSAAAPEITAAGSAMGPVAAPGVVAATAPAAAATTAATTGGALAALEKYGPIAADAGSIATQSAASQADGRRSDADANMRATAANNLAAQRAAEFNRDLPGQRTNETVRGEVLNTMQDAPMTGDPRLDKFNNGGVRPSMIGPQGRAAGAELSRASLAKLMNPATDEYHPTPIEPTEAGWGENITAGVGLGGSVVSLLGKYGKIRKGA